MKGGYQIIDLGGATITGKMPDFLNKIKDSNNKPIYLTNFKISTTLYTNVYLCNQSSGSNAIVLSFMIANTCYKISLDTRTTGTYYGTVTLTSGSITLS